MSKPRILAIALALVAAACGGADAEITPTTAAAPPTTTTAAPATTTTVDLPNYGEMLTADGRFTTLIELMRVAGLSALLTAPGDGTVFLPTDEAFAALPEGLLDRLTSSPAAAQILSELILDHAMVPEERVTVAELATMSSITMFTNKVVSVEVDGAGNVVLDGVATIIDPDREVSNGMVQVIDAVLISPDFVG